MTRHILFLTGTRADFGKLEPLAAAARDAGHRVTFFVTGMHMMERYGLTKLEVQRMPGVRVHEFLNQRPGDGQDIVLAKTVIGFSDYITEHQPDLIVIHGDRIEALAGALVAATNYIASAHIEGGEVSGTIDEVFRHCNTKLATHHFVSSDTAKRRVMALGEPEEAIHVIGSPELDFHAAPSGVTLEEVRARYDIPFDDYGIAVFHPVTSEQATMAAQAQALFGALEASGRNFVVIAPNNDPGSESIFAVLRGLPKDRFRLIPSMRFAHFSELMKHAACMVGNSSAGVREAPFLGIPSLDVGTRQTNRAMAASVAFAAAGDAAAVAQFLTDRWGQRHAPDTGFGTGRAADRFAQTLARPEFWAQGLQKAFRDQDNG
ncbi:UDP-N-acetylglucosamine 2-epimerase [Pseudotabrizicola alkalilacus]|uniref:UDP-N-acetylglucosamine 2-epimerase (Hydrolyzing) n=1 Tax=Pseudotabrizicola alkalilacus TaxID=2305252 RepID=A0A411Z2G1_9RHOB|nr:UDP-N-acetylglucosamine 2-epimerase [Pseudotabrizicola alkalilacus]RGP37212.1 UDP-N-acetylglucosamine 2-epimerase (hydrolyzing) [Pseudotabrizicola alkalilacus]